MGDPCLVILAAGMGSRFGGLKQITAVDDHGHAIIDFSLYDAWQAGFRKVVFIIKHAIEADFRAAVADRMAKHFDVRLVFHEIPVRPSPVFHLLSADKEHPSIIIARMIFTAPALTGHSMSS